LGSGRRLLRRTDRQKGTQTLVLALITEWFLHLSQNKKFH
jgi:hypothetical protein